MGRWGKDPGGNYGLIGGGILKRAPPCLLNNFDFTLGVVGIGGGGGGGGACGM